MLSLRVCYDLLSWDVDNSSVMLLSVRGRVTAYPGWRIDSMWLRLELILFRLLFFVINRSRWIELCYYQRSRDVAPYLEYRYRIDKRNALCGVNALTRLVFLYVSFEVNSICNQQRAEEFSPHTRPTWWFDATVVKLTLCRIAVLSRLLQFVWIVLSHSLRSQDTVHPVFGFDMAMVRITLYGFVVSRLLSLLLWCEWSLWMNPAISLSVESS